MELNRIAIPAVYLLIVFLGYPSQVLFLYLEPGPLTKNELILSNVLLVFIFITYTKSVYVDPGTIPKKKNGEDQKEIEKANGEKKGAGQRMKWCRKCDAAKPPRAHHCKECKRCIPKMDHHCPWTANCVSYTTFPHFIRFLFYTVAGLSLLAYFLFIRISYIWAARNLPSYLGPSPFLLSHLFVTTIVNSITVFAIGILLVNNIWALAVNTTTIEGWEIERHKTLVRRARHFGGWLEGPDGAQMRIKKQEFPYDIGIWQNITQGMGTGNPLQWFNPLTPTPVLSTGLTFPVNGFEDASLSWPPPDPDRSFKRPANKLPTTSPTTGGEPAFTFTESTLSPQESLAAFRERQAADAVRRRKPFLQRVEAQMAKQKQQQHPTHGFIEDLDDDEIRGSSDEDEEEELGQKSPSKSKEGSQSGEEGWRNSEGERLKDFGVDEEVEFYDEQEEDDDVPLAELLARRRAAAEAAYQ